MAKEPVTIESLNARGGQILDEVKRLLHEGNVRRVVIKQEGRTIAEFPLTLGVVGAAIAPVLAVVGTLAALLTECTIEVERSGAPAERSEITDGAPTVELPSGRSGTPMS